MSTQLILYSTSSCHLCEEAAWILESLSSLDIAWHEIDIAEDDELLAIYGTRIPVLHHTDSGREINWPFTQTDVNLLIKGQMQ